MFHQIQDLKLWVLSVSSSSWKTLEGFKLLIQYPNYLELDVVAKKERWKIENSNSHINRTYSGLNWTWCVDIKMI